MRTILTRFRSLALAGALVLTLGPLVATPLTQGLSNANPYAYWVPPGNCFVSTTGTLVTTASVPQYGLASAGASNTPVIRSRATAAGAHTDTIRCNITPPSAVITSGSGLVITDAVFAYGTVNNIGTQTETLASGLFNSTQVFSYIAYPTAGASETPSTVTPVRADSGTFAIAPAAASFNSTTATAGAFYTVKFTPASQTLVWKTDQRQLILSVSFVALAGLDTTIDSPGVLVHYRGQS